MSEIVGAFDQRDPSQRTRFSQIGRIPQCCSGCFFCDQCGLGPLGYQAPFLLGQGRIKVQHKRIGVSTKFGHDERYPLGHQARHKDHVARETAQLGNNDRALAEASGGHCCCKVRPSVERVRALAGLGFYELGDDRQLLGVGEALDS